MLSDTLEVLSANIVILPEEPLKQIMNAISLFESRELAPFMRKPLTVGQGLNVDVALGTTTGMFQVESMKSQKTISLSPLRIEVHDRSGEPDLEKRRIPETMFALANALSIGRIKAIGANWEIMFKTLSGSPASKEIEEKLLLQDKSFLPKNLKPIGGAARLFLSDLSDLSGIVVYTLAIEPRGQDPLIDDLWMSCNANRPNPEELSLDLLREMYQQSYDLLFKVKETLFPVPQL